jgi:hypothetical protein
MYIDVLTGFVIGLFILIARETINYKRNKEAGIAIANYQARGREITSLKEQLIIAGKTIEVLEAQLEGEINGNM